MTLLVFSLTILAMTLIPGCSSAPPLTHDQVCEADAVARRLHAALKPDGGL